MSVSRFQWSTCALVAMLAVAMSASDVCGDSLLHDSPDQPCRAEEPKEHFALVQRLASWQVTEVTENVQDTDTRQVEKNDDSAARGTNFPGVVEQFFMWANPVHALGALKAMVFGTKGATTGVKKNTVKNHDTTKEKNSVKPADAKKAVATGAKAATSGAKAAATGATTATTGAKKAETPNNTTTEEKHAVKPAAAKKEDATDPKMATSAAKANTTGATEAKTVYYDSTKNTNAVTPADAKKVESTGAQMVTSGAATTATTGATTAAAGATAATAATDTTGAAAAEASRKSWTGWIEQTETLLSHADENEMDIANATILKHAHELEMELANLTRAHELEMLAHAFDN